MAEISKQALKVDNNQSFPNNNNGAITPSILRAFNVNMIDSLVDEQTYNQDSASWNVSIDNIEAFTASLQTAFVSTASFNAFTQSINQYTASNNTKWNNAAVATASLFTSVNNLNQFTASQVNAFNELNAWSASAKISIGALNQASSSLQSFTQSANVSITNLNTTTASLNTSVSNINTFTASAGISITNLNTTTASLNTSVNNINTFTASATISINALNQSSASQQISIDSLNSKTGSYATTGSNIFTGANTFTSISASSFVSASEFIGNGSKITGITASIALPILDEGIPQGNAFSMNFTGSGISAIVVGGTAVVSVNTPDSGTINNLTASFNAYTASTNLDLAAIHQATASLQSFTASFNTSSFVSTASFNSFTSSTNTATQSLFVSASLAIVTASVVDDDITFRKGDGTTFTIQVATGSFALSSSFAETSSITRNVVITARNGNASTLGAGTVVHITGATGDNPIFTTASYDNELLSGNTFGLLRYSSPSGADVQVVVAGVVTGVNTDPALGYAAGDIIYLSSSGQFTKVQPQAPNQIVTLGQVLRAQQNNGSIYVSINNGWELDELHNVQIINPQTGDLIQYESSSYGLWKNKSIAGAGITTTSSFNSYTSSNDQRVSSLEAVTGSFATTGSNIFNGNQTITGSLTISSSAVAPNFTLNVSGGISSTANVRVSGSSGTSIMTQTFSQLSGSSFDMIVGRGYYQARYNNQGIALYASGSSTIGGFNNAPIGVSGIAVNSGSSVSTYYYPIVFQTGLGYTDGTIGVRSPLSASAGFTASLQNGYAWVGNSLGQNTQVATSSFGGGGTINTGSFATTGSNTFTGGQIIAGGNPLTLLDGSIGLQTNIQGSGSQYAQVNITTDSATYQVGGLFAGFGIYDSNPLNSVGSFVQIAANSYQPEFPNEAVGWIGGGYPNVASSNTAIIFRTGSADMYVFKPTSFAYNVNITGSLTASLQQGYTYVGNSSGKTTTVATSSFGTPIPAGTISSSAQITSLGFVSSSITASSIITASVNLNTITFTKGDSSTFALTVNTGSGGGGAAFPYTGSAQITGSLGITGSMSSLPITLSVSANTASIDMSAGNQFVLTLPSSSTTHIAPSTIRAGQTINLLIKQQVGPGTGSITFAPSILFPSGLDMQATATGSAIDLISMISFDTTNLMAANVKNLR